MKTRIHGLWAVLFLAALPSFAAVENLGEFAVIPVMHEGRIVPMDTYARLRLAEFSGRKTLPRAEGGREAAVSWLARVLFEPAQSFDDKIFVVDNPEVVRGIKVPEASKDDHRRYSFNALRPGFEELARQADSLTAVDRKKLSPAQIEILRLHAAMQGYLNLLGTFTFTQPHPDFGVSSPEVRSALGLDPARLMFSYLEVRNRIEALRGIVEKAGGRPPEQWTPVEQEGFRLAQALFEWTRRFEGAGLTMVPADPHGGKDWFTPWDAMGPGVQDRALNEALQNLGRMSGAWARSDAAAFDRAAADYHGFIHARAGSHREVSLVRSEVAFNRFAPIYNAKMFYVLAFLAGFAALLTENRHVRRVATALVVLAVIPHLTGVVWKVVLTLKPPVYNLYGTFVTAGLVCALLGLAAEARLRNAVGAFAASVCGVVLLFIAGRYELQGDTMGKMVAVLNSTFWLTTHVITIIMGYSGCFLSAVLGVVWLVRRGRCGASGDSDALYRAVTGVFAFGFTMTFFGTMLGGIWADDSWGRFWGWDPKENGALLIVLWCAALFHARVGAMIREVGMAAGIALTGVWVAWAWFGTNLLGVGLHSYGFTSGAAMKLVGFVVANILGVAALVVWNKFRDLERKNAPAEGA